PLPRAFSPAEAALLQAFADQAALAMDSARLFEAAETGRREAEALARVARTLTESLDVGAVGERLVRSARELLQTRSASIRLARRAGGLVAVAWGGVARDSFSPGDVMPPGTGIPGRAFTSRQACWTPDLLAEPGLGHTEDVRARIAAGGARSTLAVPLV